MQITLILFTYVTCSTWRECLVVVLFVLLAFGYGFSFFRVSSIALSLSSVLPLWHKLSYSHWSVSLFFFAFEFAGSHWVVGIKRKYWLLSQAFASALLQPTELVSSNTMTAFFCRFGFHLDLCWIENLGKPNSSETR